MGDEMKVKQIVSNMTEVQASGKTILVSYSTPVAVHIEGQGFFRTSTKHSTTTSRHINKWLQGAKAQEKDQDWFDSLL